MIKFSVSRLDKEPFELEGTIDKEFISLPEGDAYTVLLPLEYRLRAEKISGGALISGSCRTSISGICGRCLEEVTQEISADDIELFYELDNVGEELDVSEDIREELLLNLPMNLLCDEDCAGLCSKCGTNLNKKMCSCNKNGSGDLAWSALDDLNI